MHHRTASRRLARRLPVVMALLAATAAAAPSPPPARRAPAPAAADSVVTVETVLGAFRIRLLESTAPATCANFRKLAGEGFYDGQTFHRIVKDFVIQAGDPNSANDNPFDDGGGGPGYTLAAEIGALHKRGSVAMARQPDSVNPERRSSGSQFYICLRDLPHLDAGGYTVFGEVVDGWETVEKLAALADRTDVARVNRDVNPGALARIERMRWTSAVKAAGAAARKPAR